MDARAFRLPWPIGVTLFEVERDDVLAEKEPILEAVGATPRCDRRLVPADLEAGWESRLVAAGFRRDAPAVFLVDGLLFYLQEEQVGALLEQTRDLGAAGSSLGADLVDLALLGCPSTQGFLSRLERAGVPWRFGTAHPEELFSARGWAASVTLPGEPPADYGRWPYRVASRRAPGFPRSYLVRAARA